MNVIPYMALRENAETTRCVKMFLEATHASVHQDLPETPSGCVSIWMNAAKPMLAERELCAITWLDHLSVFVLRVQSPIPTREFVVSLW